MGIVDEALPSDGGAGLLKVDAHDDAEVVAELGDGGLEEQGILARGAGVVDGAWTDEDEQARVAAAEDGGDVGAGVEDGGRRSFGDGQIFFEEDRRQNNFGPLNAKVFYFWRHEGASWWSALRLGPVKARRQETCACLFHFTRGFSRQMARGTSRKFRRRLEIRMSE